MNSDDLLHPEDLWRGLQTTILGRTAFFIPECESTNALARSLAERGEPEGTLVVTDYQSAGRGRLGRAWSAPPRSSLLFSLLLRPPIPASRLAQVSMAAGLGCAAGIARQTGITARLKWPNDITLAGRKAGGILSEFGLEGDSVAYVIVGIGLNVNFDPATIQGIPPEAISLAVQAGANLPRAPLLRAILEEMEMRYRAMCGGASLRAEWEHALETVGRMVRVTTHTAAAEGLAESVEESGALILRLADGSRQIILAGDVVNLRAE